MRQIPIIMPQLGESIAEATIIRLLVNLGDTVTVDQEVMEVETNKATMNITSPGAGRVSQLQVEPGQSYPVGAVLGYLEAKEEKGRTPEETAPPETRADSASTSAAPVTPPSTSPGRTQVQPTIKGLPVPAHAAGASYMSPRMKARMDDLGLHAADLAGIAGSGAAGRVTVGDFETFLENLEKKKLTAASSMRVAVADAMRRSWTRPLAMVALPVALDALLQHRQRQNPRPGPTLYALRALSLALAENSAPAGRLVGSHIVHPSAIDIGFAVEAEDGVLVPVLRHADRQPFSEMVLRYNELVKLARQRQLPVGATGGSIATVTNFGSFGLTLATPIPLPEQTLVLGMGAGRKVPNWDEEKQQFVPVTEAYLTLSFDHRVLDGGAAGRLLTRIATLMSKPEEL